MPRTTQELNLFAALLACHAGKVPLTEYRTMACILGVSYDTVEGRMRVIKKQAQELLQEAKDAGRVDADGKIKNETPAKKRVRSEDKDGVDEVSPRTTKRARAAIEHDVDEDAASKVEKETKRGRKIKVETED